MGENDLDPVSLIKDEIELLSQCETHKEDFEGVEAGREAPTSDLFSDIDNFKENG